MESIDFDEYLPVFIYSHAEYPNYEDECNDMLLSTELEDYFIKVPEDMAIVDPIIPLTGCTVSSIQDKLFPKKIIEYGNNAFLKSKYMPFRGLSRKQNATLGNMFNNTKLYYENDIYHNLKITFENHEMGIGERMVSSDTEDTSEWSIRVPERNRVGNYTGRLVEILRMWKNEYVLEDDDEPIRCIFLTDLIAKLREETTKERLTNGAKNPLYNEKLLLYFISCRIPTDEETFMEETSDESINDENRELYESVLQNQMEVEHKGVTNTAQLRNSMPSDRITRRSGRINVSDMDETQ